MFIPGMGGGPAPVEFDSLDAALARLEAVDAAAPPAGDGAEDPTPDELDALQRDDQEMAGAIRSAVRHCLAADPPPVDAVLGALQAFRAKFATQLPPRNTVWAYSDGLAALVDHRAATRGLRAPAPPDLGTRPDAELYNLALTLPLYFEPAETAPDPLAPFRRVLTHGQVALLACHWIAATVRSGGFEKLFGGSQWGWWLAAREAAERVGAAEHLPLFEAVDALLGPGCTDPDEERRWAALEQAESAALQRLDDRFNALNSDPDRAWLRLTTAYVRAHPGEFFE